MTPGFADVAINSGKYDAIVAYYNLIETEMSQFFSTMEVQELILDMDMNWETFGIKFCLAHPMVSTVVLGLNNPAQVAAAVQAADGNYPHMALVHKIMETISSNRPNRNTWI
ncbi:hypothetical protein EDC18_102271 [Natranaerovirga pectinivora]|uniref:Aldo/keto reductase family protein n=1 Tax=Natranaerovirga pectinivora TaxID=682400 RepID=A0A4R3MT76_9FIRM|nr:hypothetical protein [Natranaerovirga pectinivora]TCT16254.1 hypothetical protein EDC18_102271 [Natranaerovirga pectinivora]